MNDPEIVYDENNLEGICIDCHNKEHFKKTLSVRPDLKFDRNGNLIMR